MRRSIRALDLYRVGIALSTAGLIYMQTKVLEAVYKLPVIEQQLIELNQRYDLLEHRVRIIEDTRGHAP